MKLLLTLKSFIIFFLFVQFTEAQEIFTPASRSQSLGGAFVCLHDSWSVFGNQASLSKINRPVIGGSFQNRFLVKELSTSAGLFILPIQSSVFALSFYQFGKNAFRQEKLGIAFARSIHPRIHTGIQFNYYRFYLPEDHRYEGTYGIELGFQYQLTRKALLGIHALNPYKTGIKTYSGQYYYPSRFSFGSFVRISDSFGWIAELEKDLAYPLIIKTGLEYDLLNKLIIRTGFAGKPYQVTAGIGFVVKKLEIDLAVAYNQYLGNSPSASFQYHF